MDLEARLNLRPPSRPLAVVPVTGMGTLLASPGLVHAHPEDAVDLLPVGLEDERVVTAGIPIIGVLGSGVALVGSEDAPDRHPCRREPSKCRGMRVVVLVASGDDDPLRGHRLEERE